MSQRIEALFKEQEVIPSYMRLLGDMNYGGLHFGGKAENLDILTTAGLPVPPGVKVASEVSTIYQTSGELPIDLVPNISVVRSILGGKIAIRSSATCEDGNTHSMAGVFETVYINKDDNIEEAIKRIYGQAQSPETQAYLQSKGIDPQTVQMGLVVQKLIPSEKAGVLYTSVNGGSLLYEYVEGMGDTLVDGDRIGSIVVIDKESGTITHSKGYDDHPLDERTIESVQDIARKVEKIYSGQKQDVELAEAAGEVYVVQSRPMTREIDNVYIEPALQETVEATRERLRKLVAAEQQELGTSGVIFTDSNFSELLPQPTQMDYGVFEYIFTGQNGIPGAIQLGRKEMGYMFDDKAIGFMKYIGGRPYSSLTGDALTFYAGFPSTQQEYIRTFGENYLKSVEEDPQKGHYPEMGLYIQDPTQQILIEKFGEEKGGEYFEHYKRFQKGLQKASRTFMAEYYSERLPKTGDFINNMQTVDITILTESGLIVYNQQILEELRKNSCVDFVKAARLGFYFSQRLRMELQALYGDEQQAESIFSQLAQGLDGSMITEANIKVEEADEEAAIDMARKFVGHLGSGQEMEIRTPRLGDDEEALTAYVQGLRRGGRLREDFKRAQEQRRTIEKEILEKAGDKKGEFEDIMSGAQIYMALRETVKYYFLKEYALLRDGLIELGKKTGLDEGDIFYLYPTEIGRLAKGKDALLHLIKERKRVYEHQQQLNMPPVIRRSDIDGIDVAAHKNGTFTESKGHLLSTAESVNGTVVNIDEFASIIDAQEKIQKLRTNGEIIILVGKQMNLSHDSLIHAAKAIVIENAGIVSHGAQRARELGRGAIGGINTRVLKTGMRVEHDPHSGMVRKIE